MSKILICGAGGFIGGHLVSNLLKEGHELVCADIKPTEFWFQIYENNASNAILYSYLCGGIFGLFIIIFLYINFANIIYKITFVKRIFFKNNILLNFSIVTLSYLLIRSIFENSFSLFSIDFMILILCYFIISETNNKLLKKIN
jgi:hypothetical protein